MKTTPESGDYITTGMSKTRKTCLKYVLTIKYKINGKYFNIQQNIVVNEFNKHIFNLKLKQISRFEQD